MVTADAVAVKPALLAFAATVTLAGTFTAVLLLARLTTRPPLGAGPLSVTVKVSVAAPVTVALEQAMPFSVVVL